MRALSDWTILMPSSKASLIKKLGSEEAYRQYMRDLAKKPHRRHFDNPDKAKEASSKGHKVRWSKNA